MTARQLADRFEAFELPAWRDDGGLAQLIDSFGSSLPLRQPSALREPKLQQRIHALTEGVMVRVCRLVEAAAVRAIESGAERIATDSLTDDLATHTLVSISDRPEPAANRMNTRWVMPNVLPMAARPYVDEQRSSWLHRLAAANWLSPAELLAAIRSAGACRNWSTKTTKCPMNGDPNSPLNVVSQSSESSRWNIRIGSKKSIMAGLPSAGWIGRLRPGVAYAPGFPSV